MILITGAGGKTGRAILSRLAARGEPVRVLVRRPDQAQPAVDSGAADAVVGDFFDRTAVEGAARGVRAIYHICPNVHPDEIAIGEIVIAAAKTAGVEQFVYHSVLHPQTEGMPHHWKKLRVEERLLESQLGFTILQPAAYMQNVLGQWSSILQNGVYSVPYSIHARLGMVDLEDVAEAAALVLTQPRHLGAVYELAGPEALTQVRVAEIISYVLEKPVRAETIPLDAWEKSARAAGLGDYAVETLLKMFCYYDQNGLWGNPNVLGWLLQRRPHSFVEFVERVM